MKNGGLNKKSLSLSSAAGVFLPLIPAALWAAGLDEKGSWVIILPVFYMLFAGALWVVMLTRQRIFDALGLRYGGREENELNDTAQGLKLLNYTAQDLKPWQMRAVVFCYWMLWSGFFFMLFMAGN